MDVLKSYAHQVVSYHPEKVRDEMFEELYNELCEEFADWQLDHPDANQAAFLDAEKEHPMRFATRLAPEGSAYLIGPQFYYSFISALKVAVVVTVGFHLFLGIISALGSGNYAGSITRMMISVPGHLDVGVHFDTRRIHCTREEWRTGHVAGQLEGQQAGAD